MEGQSSPRPGGIDASAVDPAEFARSVAQTPDEQLAEGMRGEYRETILDGIFKGMEDHFDPERARDVDAVIDWKILDRPGGGNDHYQVAIKDGTCTVSKEPKLPARLTFTVGPVDFLKLVTGNASGPQMFMFGKLKIEGDLMFAARVQDLFRLPEGVTPPPAGEAPPQPGGTAPETGAAPPQAG
jgi:putative sterol carrier protein